MILITWDLAEATSSRVNWPPKEKDTAKVVEVPVRNCFPEHKMKIGENALT